MRSGNFPETAETRKNKASHLEKDAPTNSMSRQALQQRLQQDYDAILGMSGIKGKGLSPALSAGIAFVVVFMLIMLISRMSKKAGLLTNTVALVGSAAAAAAVFYYRKKTCQSCLA